MSNSPDQELLAADDTAITPPNDPVLTALHDAEAHYLEERALAYEQSLELLQARSRLAHLADQNRSIAEELKEQRGELVRERRRTQRQRERAAQLLAGLRDVHRALFDGNVFSLILKACLTLTGATRGVYVIARDGDLRVRAAVDVDGYPQSPPSDFLRALAGRALADGQSVVCHAPDQLPAAPERPGEQFRNCIAAPVVLLHDLNGIIIVADKLHGDFDEEDVETLLSVGDNAAVAVQNRQLQHELQTAYLSVVGVLADAVEAKDPYTHGHCALVARYARLTAQRLAADDRLRGLACYGGLLHDIGKIGVSDGVLNKPGRLLPEEMDLMRSHVRVGRDLLARVPVLDSVADVVLHHHERYDGGGYPDGLKGDDISLAARIVGVADAYCAMISKRSYKEALSGAEARAELLRVRGTQFDPAVVDAFLAVLDSPEADLCDDPDPCGPPPGFDPDEFRHLLPSWKALGEGTKA